MSQFDDLVVSFANTAFTAFDTETTGLEPRTNRIVELGGIRMDSLGVQSRFNSLINPGMPMPSEASRINGITDAMLASQPDAKLVLPDFMRFASRSVLIAHNAPFDISFMNEELRRLGLPAIQNRVVDTRIFAREMFPGLPKYSLQELALRFGINARDAHRAEDDARVCLELFLVCLEELKKKKPHLVEAAKQAVQGKEEDTDSLFAEKTQSRPQVHSAPQDSEDLFTEELDIEDETFDENPL